MQNIPLFIQNIIKNLCDVNGNGKLDAYVEIGNRAYDENTIFEKACQSYNHDNKTVSIFKNGKWETTNIGDDINIKFNHFEPQDKTRIDNSSKILKYVKPNEKKTDSESQIISDAINNGSAKKTVVGNNIIYKVDIPTNNKNTKHTVEITKNRNGEITMKRDTIITQNGSVTSVKKEITNFNQKNTTTINSGFQYDKKKLENYVINDAVTGSNQSIKTFADIDKIRKKTESERTDKEKNKLNVFNDMIKYSINAGIDYGVDPKLILCIIQQEVKFDGFGNINGASVTGNNGKGYMQITSSPIIDFMNATQKDFSNCSKGYKVDQYGQEMRELLIQKGYNIDKAETKEQKKAIYQSIYEKLKLNDDPDFNIRLGTLVLRKNLNSSQGDIYKAAYNYNGSPKYRQNYGTNVKKFYTEVNKTVPSDSTYSFHKTILASNTKQSSGKGRRRRT